jgi:uncharacterized protein (DUF983 family)
VHSILLGPAPPHRRVRVLNFFTTPFDNTTGAKKTCRNDDQRRLGGTLAPRRFGPLSVPGSVWGALWRGARDRCPACGAAQLFAKFLKPIERCSTCGEDWTRHNADDLPPYIVILVIGHVVVSGMTSVEVAFHPPMWGQLAIWIPATIALAIGLMQPAKGGVIALQWWHRMGSFQHRPIPEPRQTPSPEVSC